MTPPIPKVQQQAIQQLRAASSRGTGARRLLKEAAEKGWYAVLQEAVRVHGQELPVSPNGLLHAASRFGRDHARAVEVLLAAGADPNAPRVMAYCGTASLPLLIEAGGDVNGGRDVENPLLVAIVKRTKQDKALALIESGADANVADANGVTAVMHAAALGRNKVFDALVRAGADLYAVDRTGRSVARHIAESFTGGTHLSMESDRKNATRIARQLKRMLPAQPEDHILLTIALGEADELERLIAAGLDPHTMLVGGMGLIGLSLDDLCERWQEHGGLLEAAAVGAAFPSTAQRDEEMQGMTLLMWATAMRQTECVRVLLEHGADSKAANPGGVSALSIAEARNDRVLVQRLSGGEELRRAAAGPARAGSRNASRRCHLLGLSQSETQKTLDQQTRRLSETYAERRSQFAGRWAGVLIEDHWEIACLEHLLEQSEACRRSLGSLLELAHELFFGPHLDQPEANVRALRGEIEWVWPLARALAAGSALGEWAQVEKLLTYPAAGCHRGDKSPTFGPEWYEWPLWRHLGALARGEKPDPEWLREMKTEATRKSKAMLAAFEALSAGSGQQVQKAIDRIVQGELAWHKSIWKQIRADRCVSAEATYFFHWARRESLDVEFLESWQPHVLNFAE